MTHNYFSTYWVLLFKYYNCIFFIICILHYNIFIDLMYFYVTLKQHRINQ